ncbi:aminotransferase, class I/II [Halobacteriovorax sp. BALOs_7]|uniref:Aminotransferase class III-fold pyridoxal phosphate-dependent enzyme n=1 Tax=Halobacteriovorax vibrionivorans TaxID=2152716 RepID=A0ABY0IM71_9BACT|nr:MULTISPECIES: aminotransferase class III-fold pyridoxal phosphate-dependent enzyme [Halobacteriovorax]AYF45948.1 aminotransferase, class I/II [Halobacteriovorax sp. BALOs_7]RZF22981.1 aminotransferase class III-fold pyridoxal phosphate-dependent enzyme [Halobacteriovorax vibrionivorans]TGD46876.1 aminotransferase class III-fold pyridoxal phosphate-dependent enzyme [Halobacteriovorax sp. Y22]
MEYGVRNNEINDQFDKLFSSILKEQKNFMEVRGPQEGKEHLVEETLKAYNQERGKGIYFNYVSSGRGHGPFTELIDGSVKYDLIGGIGPNLLGHSHPIYIKSHLEAALGDSVMCGNLQPYPQAIELTNNLLSAVKESNLKHFWFTGSGSFANDLALKLVWQKKDPAYRVIAFKKAFAGRSVATQDITHNANYRQGMPKSLDVDHVPHFDQNNPEDSLKNTLAALEEVTAKHPNQHCAIMLEIIQGEGGFIFGPKEYYEEIFKWAKKKGLYIWIDEVQTFGRTRELFAFQTMGLDKYVDIVSVGKALQVCGVLYSEELNPKPGLIAGTFNGSVSALSTGSKLIKYLTEGNFYGDNGRIKELEDKFITKLTHLMKNSCKDKMTYVGGIGTMIAFEVGDSTTETVSKFVKALFNNGIVAFMAGKEPTRVRLLLPLAMTDEHIDDIISIIEKTILEEIN